MIRELKNSSGDYSPEDVKKLARAAGKALQTQSGFTKTFKTSERNRVYTRGYCRKVAELKNRLGDYKPEEVKELARAAGKALLAQSGFSICGGDIQTVM